jgi:hypothetical protein
MEELHVDFLLPADADSETFGFHHLAGKLGFVPYCCKKLIPEVMPCNL